MTEETIKGITEFINMFDKEEFEVTNTIDTYIRSSDENFKKDYNLFNEQFNCNFNVINKAIEIINYIKKDKLNGHNLVQLLLINNSLTFLYGSYDSSKRGFYSNASVLLRSYFESMIRVYYISYNPTNYSGILGKNFMKETDKKFNLKNFLEQNLKNGWEKTYNILSLECHSNTRKTVVDIDKYQKSNYKIQFDLLPNKHMELFNYNIIMALTYATLIFLKEIFLEDFKIENKQYKQEMEEYELIEKLNKSIEVLGKTLNSVDEEKYSNHYLEITEIMKNIMKLEKGKQ